MTPDEARKDCEICGGRTWLCQYREGWRDGYEAAQREREEDSATHYPDKLTWEPLSCPDCGHPNESHWYKPNSKMRRCSLCLDWGVNAHDAESVSETPQGRPGRP